MGLRVWGLGRLGRLGRLGLGASLISVRRTARLEGLVGFLERILGSPFDLASRLSKVGYGDYNRVSRGY